MAENSPDGKPYVRSTDAINVNMSQISMTQLSQVDSGSQVGFCIRQSAPDSGVTRMTCMHPVPAQCP